MSIRTGQVLATAAFLLLASAVWLGGSAKPVWAIPLCADGAIGDDAGVADDTCADDNTPPPGVVPEPGTMALAGLGAAALGFSFRRRKRS